MKIVQYKPMQITIDTLGFAEVFIDIIVQHGPPRPSQLDCTSRLSRYLKVLVFFVLLPGRQANYNLVLVVNLLKKMLRDKPMQIPIDVSRLFRLNYQWSRLSLHLQVLIPPILLSSWIAVTAHTSPYEEDIILCSRFN